MGRPIKQGVDWFKHDTDMRNDPKIKALRRKFGLPGYAVYCMVIEIMADSDRISTVENPLNLELLAGDFDIRVENLTEIIDYCVKVNLFTRERDSEDCINIITSRRLKLDMQAVFDARNSDREYFQRRKVHETGVSAPFRTKSRVENSKVEEVEPPPPKGAGSTSLQESELQEKETVDKSVQSPSLSQLEKAGLIRAARESKKAGIPLLTIELRALQEIGEEPPDPPPSPPDDFDDSFPEAT